MELSPIEHKNLVTKIKKKFPFLQRACIILYTNGDASITTTVDKILDPIERKQKFKTVYAYIKELRQLKSFKVTYTADFFVKATDAFDAQQMAELTIKSKMDPSITFAIDEIHIMKEDK
jgi:hypothetical protein